MRRNLGSAERFERGAIGAALILLSYSSSNWVLFTASLFLGTVLLGEAFSGHCTYRHYWKKR